MNHDRINNDRDVENTAEGAKLLNFMLKRTLPEHVIVEFHHRILKFNSGNLRFIIQHGNLRADKKSKVEEVVWKHGEIDKFNIVLVGHKHTRILADGDDVHNARRIGLPPFCPADDYTDDGGWDNNPGYLIILEKEGKPQISDVPLCYTK